MSFEQYDNQFVEKVKQVQASLLVSNNLTENADRKLYEEDILLIQSRTDYSRDDIKVQFQSFLSFCPSGVFFKDRLRKILHKILPEIFAHIAADQIFECFDNNGRDFINFTEFIIGSKTINSMSMEEKLENAYDLLDPHKNGSIEIKQIIVLFATLYMNEGLDKYLAVERAYSTFSILDTGSNGTISKKEFILGCIQDKKLVQELSIN